MHSEEAWLVLSIANLDGKGKLQRQRKLLPAALQAYTRPERKHNTFLQR